MRVNTISRFVDNTYGFIYLLFSILIVITSFLNIGLLINIGSYNLRLSYIIVLAFLIFIIFLFFFNFNTKFKVPYYKLFLSFIFIYFLATLINLNSKYFTRGVADCFLLSLNFLHYLVLVSFLINTNYYDLLFKFFIYTGGILSLGAVILIFLKFIGVDTPFFNYYRVTDFTYTGDISLFPRLKFLGPVSGGFLATVSLIGFSYWLQNKNKKTFYIFISSVLTFVVMILSFARGPLLGFIVGFFLFIFLNIAKGKISKTFLKKIFVIFLIFIMIFSIISLEPSIREIVFGKVKHLLNIEQGTGAYRISWWEKMFYEFLEKPFLGYGASNYRKFREVGDVVGVSENIYVEILHSSGIIGFGIFFIVNLFIILKALRKIFIQGINNVYLISFLCGYICILIIAFTNPIAWTSFFWVVLAFLIATIRISKVY